MSLELKSLRQRKLLKMSYVHVLTFKKVRLIDYSTSGIVPDMRITVWLIRNTSPFIGNIQGISVSSSVGMVFIHPVMISSEKVCIENKLVVWALSYPVKNSIKSTFTNT